jgi:SAM-dependent methyltransferase
MAKRADTRYLRDVAYADPSGLAARASLYDFQQPRIDLQSEMLAALGPLDGRVVGDIGCGDGRYIAALRGAGAQVVGIDLSVGMLAGVPDPPALVAADSQALPLVDRPQLGQYSSAVGSRMASWIVPSRTACTRSGSAFG